MRLKFIGVAFVTLGALLAPACRRGSEVQSPANATPAPDLSVPSPVEEEKIKGAFGKNFGDVFEPSSAVGEDTLNSGRPVYQFAPEKEFRSFKTYQVLITPKTHRIYHISAEGPIEDVETGNKEAALIMQMLVEKYGEQKPRDSSATAGDESMYSQGHRWVGMTVRDRIQPVIRVDYGDVTLSTLADAEEAEMTKERAKKADSSGL